MSIRQTNWKKRGRRSREKKEGRQVADTRTGEKKTIEERIREKKGCKANENKTWKG